MKKENKKEHFGLPEVRNIFKGAYARYFQEEHRREGVVFNSLGNIGVKEKEQLLIMQSVRVKVLNLIPSVYGKVDSLLFNELERDAELKAQKKASVVFNQNEIDVLRQIYLSEKENLKKTPLFYKNSLRFSDVDKKIKDKAISKIVKQIEVELITLDIAFEKIFEIIGQENSQIYQLIVDNESM